jgi:hypothetical protein
VPPASATLSTWPNSNSPASAAEIGHHLGAAAAIHLLDVTLESGGAFGHAPFSPISGHHGLGRSTPSLLVQDAHGCPVICRLVLSPESPSPSAYSDEILEANKYISTTT